MFNPSTPKKYKAPIGRIAQVQSIQDYSKKQKLKVKDFYSQKHIRNPRNRKSQFDDYRLEGGLETSPAIHRDTPKLQQGKVKPLFKDNILFEMDKKETKGKKPKKTRGPKKPKKLILDYRNEFHKA